MLDPCVVKLYLVSVVVYNYLVGEERELVTFNCFLL